MKPGRRVILLILAALLAAGGAVATVTLAAASHAAASHPPYTEPGGTFHARSAAYKRLSHAAGEGRRREVALWLSIGLDPNQDDGESLPPLIAAAERGRLDVMRDLVARGAKVDVELRIHDRLRALDAAVEGGQLAAVEYLLASGADPSGMPEAVSPLQRAVMACRPDFVRVLLAAGARIDRTPFAPQATKIYGPGSVCPEILAMLDPSTRAALEPR